MRMQISPSMATAINAPPRIATDSIETARHSPRPRGWWYPYKSTDKRPQQKGPNHIVERTRPTGASLPTPTPPRQAHRVLRSRVLLWASLDQADAADGWTGLPVRRPSTERPTRLR